MSHTRDSLAVLRLAKQRGLNVSRMSPVRFAKLALDAQGGIPAQATAVKRALSSRVRTEVMHQVVPKATRDANEATCRACPHGALTQLRDGTLACGSCGCQGAFLESKWNDPLEHCPLTVGGRLVIETGLRRDDPPTWSNLEVPSA